MTQDERIKEILKWGPMSALYFTIAVDVLNQVLDRKDDDFVFDLFGRMIPAIENMEAIEAIKALLTQVAS